MKICMHTSFVPYSLSLKEEPKYFDSQFLDCLKDKSLNIENFGNILKPGDGLFGSVISNGPETPIWEDFMIEKITSRLEDKLMEFSPDYIHKNLETIKQKANELFAHYTRQSRDNAFYYTVNEDKIFKPDGFKELSPYVSKITNNDVYMSPFDEYFLDADKIRADGYDGIEYSEQLVFEISFIVHEDNINTPQICNFCSKGISPIEKEIALLSKHISDSLTVFDYFDKDMDPEYLKQWVINPENKEKIELAIQSNIFTKEDLEYFQNNTKEYKEKLSQFENISNDSLNKALGFAHGQTIDQLESFYNQDEIQL